MITILLLAIGISACKDVYESTGPLFHDEWVALLQSTATYKDNTKIVMLFVVKYLIENLILAITALVLFHFMTQYTISIYKYSFKPTYRFLSFVYLISFIFMAKPLYKPPVVTSSKFLYENSVLPSLDEIEFPEKKKNLIFISLEAYETMYFSKEHGGIYETSKSPNLESFAFSNNSIFFSNLNGDKVGGVNVIPRTKFTTAAQFAMACGYAFLTEPPRSGLTNNEPYFPKFKCLWDILKEVGYNTTVTYGTTPNDWGIGDLYYSHGINKLWSKYDVLPNSNDIYALDRDITPFFMKALTEMSQSKDPFFASFLTLDTHEPGFKCQDCIYEENSMITVVKCSDKRISNLLKWMEQQSWYNNTVIALFGDHIVRGNGYPELAERHNFSRRPFNMIINSGMRSNYTRNREFTSMDIYPTLLTAIGTKVKKNQLGMGIDLFSGLPTLVEKYGIKKFIKECEGTKIFYNHIIHGIEDDGIRVKGFF
ncbi:hypothetical protein TVAG_128600 [Trichomonas vaginalis G3]|uniref:Sulfatase N-terminal domain-containing protein n=1 Tax=Trichomonas vaginalis (strain ATCC PRA-98 / G3) TaxID=412133 RepID=A2GI07_TRIV3|nr:lipoteichoic acid synthase family [Trichomonas vaginalis G3]EAX83210.1 hypothetical protein TVAG_128600 [Trichomonas vaginalis G3]KAI5513578.1 lipoteichoic acid synthase family [Trichomonas vaginalis G3]|eukprot:XP_001296140.1 hypothetical protein [Trichomonas vaginalis G3]